MAGFVQLGRTIAESAGGWLIALTGHVLRPLANTADSRSFGTAINHV
jgi:hypothetical protein